MIEFKKNIKSLLPYDRAGYIKYLKDNFEPAPTWYGVSFQLNAVNVGREIGLSDFFEFYEPLFKMYC